jgi:hypothetical protein
MQSLDYFHILNPSLLAAEPLLPKEPAKSSWNRWLTRLDGMLVVVYYSISEDKVL